MMSDLAHVRYSLKVVCFQGLQTPVSRLQPIKIVERRTEYDRSKWVMEQIVI